MEQPVLPDSVAPQIQNHNLSIPPKAHHKILSIQSTLARLATPSLDENNPHNLIMYTLPKLVLVSHIRYYA